MARSPYARTCRIKGSSIASRVKWVQLYHGETGVKALEPHVGKELVETLSNGTDIAEWYPLNHFVELNTAIDRVFGKGDLAMVTELARYAAEASLTTVFRPFFKTGTVEWMLARAARLWGMHYDSGRLLIREFANENLVEVEIVDFGDPSRVHCLAVQGWAERAAELTDVQGVELREVDCRANGDQRCRFRIKWG